MAGKEPSKVSKKHKISLDAEPDDFDLYEQVRTDKNLGSGREVFRVICDGYRSLTQNEEKQANAEVDCEFFLFANKKLYCVYESYGRHRQLISKEECAKCKIHMFKLPQKSKIPLCPKTNGLYSPLKCEACFQAEPTTYANCETQRFFRVKSEPQPDLSKETKKPQYATERKKA